MEERYDISVDAAEGKDKGLVTLFEIGENGEYRPIAACDSISFDGNVEHSGYVGVETGELSFSVEELELSCDILRMLFGGWSDEFKAQGIAFSRLLKTYDELAKQWERFCSLACKGKPRKTTYRTIRRDCAKRNRHK